jgi:hypothetical protein
VNIVEPVEYQDNDTAAWVSGTDVINTAINQTFTQTKFDWALLAGTVGILDTEMADNMGKHQLVKLLTARTKNLTNTFKEKLEDAFGDSSTDDVTTVWSLPDVVDSSNPTLGNYGDVDRSANSWWQATETASGSVATQGLEDIRTAYYTTSRGNMDPVNMLLTTQTVYEAYQARMTVSERLAKSDSGDLEFDHLAFNGKPLFFSESLASGLLLGLNTKYIKLKINKHMNFKSQGFVRAPGGQSKSSVIQTRLQLVCTRPASQFKLTGLTA